MKFGFAAILLATTATGAMAADMPSAAPYQKAPYVSPAYNWTGFYIGVMGGYGWSQSANLNGISGTTHDIKGAFAGGTLGYNWQAAGSPVVFGIEADGAWSDINYSATEFGITAEDRIRAFGSVTGRVGYAVDAALFYAKGGYAWADNRFAVTGLGTTLYSESHIHSGWTVGGGLEYGFTPNLSGKIEYMYASYENQNYAAAFIPGGVGIGLDEHTIKAGLNYRFGWGGPVVARY